MQTTAKGFKKPDDIDNADLKIFVGDNMDTLETELDKKIDKTKIANSTELGLVKIGTGITIGADGTISTSGGGTAGTFYAFHAYQTTAQAFTAGQWIRCSFEAMSVDVGNDFDLTLDEYVVPETGTYAIGGSVSWGSGQLDGNRTVMAYYKNGVSAGWIADLSVGSAGQGITTGNTIVSLNAGDKLSLWVYTAGANTTQIVSGNALTYFYGHKIG